LLNLIDSSDDEREVPIKRAIEHIPDIALSGGSLFLAVGADFAAKGRHIIQDVVAVRGLHYVDNPGEIFLQSAIELRRKATVTVAIAIDAFNANFLLNSVPILGKHDRPPSC
jgi:hypothetical protein